MFRYKPSNPSIEIQTELQILGNLLQVQRVRKPGGTQIVEEVSANLGSRICGKKCRLLLASMESIASLLKLDTSGS